MPKIFNAHRVFYDGSDADFWHQITPTKERLTPLREARELIRQTLRQAVPMWGKYVNGRALFESALLTAPQSPSVIQPKFRQQGSMAYHTLNEPANEPPQEIDCDDGMFLPISFLEQGGATRPAIISRGLFLLVEKALAPLCDAQGWTLNSSKPSCVRVQIDDTEHVDIALYAIPDSDFATLVEAVAVADSLGKAFLAFDAAEFDESQYQQLPRDHIMLAHRDEGWKPSDPRKLEDWFSDAVATHGQQLRRICRYIKAWRDYQWDSCRLSSIALMRCVVDTYGVIGATLLDNRDDLALLRAAERLPEQLSRAIPNPVVEGQILDEGWSSDQRREFIAAANNFARQVKFALNDSADAKTLLKNLTIALGDRVPSDAQLVSDETPAQSLNTRAVAPAITSSSYAFPDVSAAPSKPRTFA